MVLTTCVLQACVLQNGSGTDWQAGLCSKDQDGVKSPGPAQRSTNHQPSPGPPTENQSAMQGGFSLVGGGRGGRAVLFHGGDITGLEGSLGRQSLPGGAKVQRLQAVADRWNQGAKGLEGNRK